MKNLSLILNGVLFIAVIILFFLVLGKGTGKVAGVGVKSEDRPKWSLYPLLMLI